MPDEEVVGHKKSDELCFNDWKKMKSALIATEHSPPSQKEPVEIEAPKKEKTPQETSTKASIKTNNSNNNSSINKSKNNSISSSKSNTNNNNSSSGKSNVDNTSSNNNKMKSNNSNKNYNNKKNKIFNSYKEYRNPQSLQYFESLKRNQQQQFGGNMGYYNMPLPHAYNYLPPPPPPMMDYYSKSPLLPLPPMPPPPPHYNARSNYQDFRAEQNNFMPRGNFFMMPRRRIPQQPLHINNFSNSHHQPNIRPYQAYPNYRPQFQRKAKVNKNDIAKKSDPKNVKDTSATKTKAADSEQKSSIDNHVKPNPKKKKIQNRNKSKPTAQKKLTEIAEPEQPKSETTSETTEPEQPKSKTTTETTEPEKENNEATSVDLVKNKNVE